MVFVKESDAAAQAAVEDFNDDIDLEGGRYLLQKMNAWANRNTGYKARLGWFQGSEISPETVKAARDFCIELGADPSWPMMAVVWQPYIGGTAYSACLRVTSVEGFKGWVER